MIVKFKSKASNDNIQQYLQILAENGVGFYLLDKQNCIVIPKEYANDLIPESTCVEERIEIKTPYQLASKAYKNNTKITVGEIEISADTFTLMAGPCSVEGEEQIFKTAKFLASLDIPFIRGGAFKPRTSPYSFKGLGVTGLRLMRQAADEFGLKVVTELLDIRMLDVVQQYADVIQVGSRNMQNFPLLQELGKVKKPVLLKRGMHAKVNEWLLGAEYILIGGNENVILCERGIRSFDPLQRNVMDLGVISLLKELSHLPVISDPSHGTGASLRVKPMALASLAAGADGLLIEIHPNPNQALSDAQQAIDFDQFEQLYRAIQDMIPVIGNKNIQLLKREPLKLQTLS